MPHGKRTLGPDWWQKTTFATTNYYNKSNNTDDEDSFFHELVDDDTNVYYVDPYKGHGRIVTSPPNQENVFTKFFNRHKIYDDPEIKEESEQYITKQVYGNPHDVQQAPFQLVVKKALPTFTIGTLISYLIIFICENVRGGFNKSTNPPMFGPPTKTLVEMGAKYGPAIQDGEIWRLITYIFLTSGIIPFLLTIAAQILVIDFEWQSGMWKTLFVYIVSGMFGGITSSIFIPSIVTVGATGGICGIAGAELVHLLYCWRTIKAPMLQLIKLLGIIIVLIFFGLTPFFDNFVQISGLLFGILIEFLFFTPSPRGKCQLICDFILPIISFPIITLLFAISFVLLYRKVDIENEWCKKCHEMNCVNFTGWCHEQILK